MNVLSRLKQVATISTVAVCISVATVSQATAAERYIVSGVESWDTLNIRSQPHSKSAIIGEIPANGQNINSTGEQRGNGRSTWIRVTHNGVSGWVSKRYLATDYSFNGTSTTTAMTNQNSNLYGASVNTTVTNRTGNIYDAGTTSATRSVYVSPGNGLPSISTKRSTQYVAPQPARTNNTGSTHSHPANRCTRSVSHTHAGPAGHTHRYSCQGQATQRQVQPRQTVAVRQVVVDNNSHTHPRNQYSNAITHSHASNNRQHSHSYGGQVQQQAQVHTVATGHSHTHPRNQFSNSITHTHASNNPNHRHNYGQNGGGRQTQALAQTQRVVTQVTHIHPQTQFNARTTHTHIGGADMHLHDFLLPPAQRARLTQPTARSLDVNSHNHPKNRLTNSVTHTHANGVNSHNHSYGTR